MSDIHTESSLTRAAVEAVLDAHPAKVAAYRAGEQASFGFLLGQVMKMTGGLANAVTVNAMLRDRLEQDGS